MFSRFTTHLYAVLATLAISLACAAHAGVPKQYEVIDLGILPHANIQFTVPYAINNSGEAVGYNQLCCAPWTLFAWRWHPDTGLSELPPPPGFQRNVAVDVTDSGIIVGWADHGLSDETNSVGWIWENGQYTLLPPFPQGCPGIVPVAINENREVVGRTCQGGFPSTIFYWSQKTGYIDLQAEGLLSVGDINDAGVVAGGNGTGALLWTPEGGVIASFGTLAAPYDDGAVATAVNDADHVAGYSVKGETGPDDWRAVFGSPSTGLLGIAPTFLERSIGRGLNNNDEAVGGESNNDSADNDPWIWTLETGRVYLSGLVNDPAFTGYNRAVDINDSGWILLRGDPSAPNQLADHPVIFRPVVEQMPGDADGDGTVDVADLLMVINAWGGCPPPPAVCAADVNGDGQVDVQDLLMIVSNWS